jgi:endogenous inhibitor of DNA gyrase (YacG/DUF329 family)
MVDLGKWLNEEYRVPASIEDALEDEDGQEVQEVTSQPGEVKH